MPLYRYPAGTILNGETLTAPLDTAPVACTIEGVQHGPEICELWTPAELAALGIKRLVAEPLPVDDTGWPYLPGEPVDVETDAEILRSFPNATPDTAGSQANLAAKASAARAARNAKLAACDWTQLADAALDAQGKTAWADYRQALRDISTQEHFPLGVVWPVEPGA